jgi:hypothetical protein
MKIICSICLAPKEITGYHRDDPILECGHTKTLKSVTTTVLLEEAVWDVMQEENCGRDEAWRKITKAK